MFRQSKGIPCQYRTVPGHVRAKPGKPGAA